MENLMKSEPMVDRPAQKTFKEELLTILSNQHDNLCDIRSRLGEYTTMLIGPLEFKDEEKRGQDVNCFTDEIKLKLEHLEREITRIGVTVNFLTRTF